MGITFFITLSCEGGVEGFVHLICFYSISCVLFVGFLYYLKCDVSHVFVNFIV